MFGRVIENCIDSVSKVEEFGRRESFHQHEQHYENGCEKGICKDENGDIESGFWWFAKVLGIFLVEPENKRTEKDWKEYEKNPRDQHSHEVWYLDGK